MLEIKDLHFSYKDKEDVLIGLNINFQLKEVHGLIGANGSGKSTFFNVLKGLLKAHSGTIKLKDQELQNSDIAYLSTDSYFYPRMKGSEYLNFFSLKNSNFDIVKWNDIFNLPLDSLVDTYSTGMKKKLAFMGCIGLDKDIIMLDEPFNGLDSDSFHIFQEIILSQKKKGKTVILSSHISQSLTEICDSISYLKSGLIQNSFSKSEFLKMDEMLFSKLKSETRSKLEDL